MNYEVLFNESTSTQWTKDERFNQMFLEANKKYLQDRVVYTGHVFLNEVLSAFGLENIRRGQTEGWKTEINLIIVYKEGNEFELIFNTDGDILDVFKN